MTASAPVTENSNMLPHGGRPAETPRATIDPRCSANASTVSDTATRPSRLARASRASSDASAPAATPSSPLAPSSTYADVEPTAASSRTCGSTACRRRGEPNASSAA